MSLIVRFDHGDVVEADRIEFPWDRYTTDARCLIEGGYGYADLAECTVVFS